MILSNQFKKKTKNTANFAVPNKHMNMDFT